MTLAVGTNQFFAWLTVAAQVLIGLLLIWRFGSRERAVGNWLKRNYLWAAWVVALTATGGSLWYSEVVGFTPCLLCWWQRIFMYPQVLLLGMATWKGDEKIRPYVILMSMAGAVVAAWHYLIQVVPTISFNCGAVGYSAACSERFVLQLGYITIPMMALSAFSLMLILLWLGKKQR